MPQIMICEAFRPYEVGFIGQIERLSTEWSLSFEFVARQQPPNWYQLLLLTTNNGWHGEIGGRVPSVYYHDGLVWVFTYLGQSPNKEILRFPVQFNQTYTFDVNHRYVIDGQYRYTIYVDGVLQSSHQHEPAFQLYDVGMYGGNLTWNEPAAMVDVKLSNVKHTNFP
uniref:Galectin n=2 Tax=Clytia hemisphaerica TaxID=252671 RepID=A0A7M5X9P0_9CNID